MAKEHLKMAGKKHHRNIIPLLPTQPLPKLHPWEDTWGSLQNFSPEREHPSTELAIPRSRYRQQASPRTSHRMINDENIPPPSTQPRRSGASPLFDATVPNVMPTQHSSKLKVGCLCFSNNPH